jgi:hypothetical protein
MRHPELDDEAENVAKGARAFLDSFVTLLVSTLLYSFFLWFLTRTLQRVDVISFRFTWIQCTGIVFGFLFCRGWDRTFFKR